MKVSNSGVKEAEDYIDFLSKKDYLNTGEMRAFIGQKCKVLCEYLFEQNVRVDDPYSVSKLYKPLENLGINPTRTKGSYIRRPVLYWKRKELLDVEHKITQQCISLYKEKGQDWIKYKLSTDPFRWVEKDISASKENTIQWRTGYVHGSTRVTLDTRWLSNVPYNVLFNQ